MISKKVIKTKSGRTLRTRVISSPLHILNDIVSNLRGANNSHFYSLKGMFWRSYDLDLSTKGVKGQLLNIEVLADDFMSKGYDSDDFRKAAEAKDVVLHYGTSNSFSTISLGVALRHFINDTCRVLEPSARLLEAKTGTQKSHHRISLNTYIRELDKANVSYGFDGAFFIALYEEVWNDYKHAESSGIAAGGCSVKDGEVVGPVVTGDRLTRFKGMDVEQFVDEVLKNVKQFVDFVR